MITAVETNILLDVFLPDPHFLKSSLEKLKQYERTGSLIICEMVYAELATVFPNQALLNKSLKQANIEFKPSNLTILWNASTLWKQWFQKSQSKRDPKKILPDFFIGAHAVYYADQLLTRNRGFYRDCFHHLKVIP
jgi:predicted nucleic acid-binding protein